MPHVLKAIQVSEEGERWKEEECELDTGLGDAHRWRDGLSCSWSLDGH